MERPSRPCTEALCIDLASSAPRPGRQRFRWKFVALLLCAFIVLDKAWQLLPSRETVGATDGLLEEPGVPSRYLSSAASSASGSASGSLDGEVHVAHPHEAMFFLCIILVIGTSLLHLTNFKAFHGMQTTVALFVLGATISILLEATGLKDELGVLGRSYEMWVQIDPHLLLFTLLPPLLAGDAMSINTQVAGKVAKQCIYLAGPGVAINAGLAACFLYVYLPYDWPPMLCLTLGAILCATDPVAVVALLKELGASPTLTVQIQGESLLNDGTAIVLYTVAYRILSGIDMPLDDIISFLVRSALYAWMLGLLIGGVYYVWIKAVKNRVDHNSPLLQVALTISCAYASFTIAEGQFHVSGVLATVAASLMLAHNMWLEVVSKESMHTIWHMFEYLGNTIIFFLAGALTGNAMVRIQFVDYLHLLVIYMALTVIRGGLIISSRPLLRCMHADFTPVTIQESIVMTWGGLRGAVGLALAIMVNVDKAGGMLSQENADRALFWVGGVAFLTLVVNATSSPALVRKLGITRVAEAKRSLMMLFVGQLEVRANDSTAQLDCCDHVNNSVSDMLSDVAHHLSDAVVRKNTTVKSSIHFEDPTEDLAAARHEWENVDKHIRERILYFIPHNPLMEETFRLVSASREFDHEGAIIRVVNEAFLALVRKQYHDFVHHGESPKALAEVLLDSITHALSTNCQHLSDFWYLSAFLGLDNREHIDLRHSNWRDSDLSELQGAPIHVETGLRNFLESVGFCVGISLAIIANAIFVVIEDEMLTDADSDQTMVLAAVELLFTVVFWLEFVFRFADERCAYFKSSWNVFDFILVVLGIIGSVTHLMMIMQTSSHSASNSQGARAMKVLKTLRAVRLLRLIRMFQEMLEHRNSKDEDAKIRKRMKRVNLLMWFIRAHETAQQQLAAFFGKQGQAEVAKCILDSQRCVYRALVACAEDKKHLASWILEEQDLCRKSLVVMHDMENTIEKANKHGLLSSKEAHDVLHVFHDHMHKLEARIHQLRLGAASRPMLKKEGHARKSRCSQAVAPSDVKLADANAVDFEIKRKKKKLPADTE